MNRPHLDPLSPSITEESSHPSFQTHNLYWSYITARDGKACFSCWFFLHLPHYLRYMRHIILNTDIYIYTHTALSSLFYIYISLTLWLITIVYRCFLQQPTWSHKPLRRRDARRRCTRRAASFTTARRSASKSTARIPAFALPPQPAKTIVAFVLGTAECFNKPMPLQSFLGQARGLLGTQTTHGEENQ